MAKQRPIIPPYQKKISVQDVRSTNTPAGISMENEEMRRLALSVNKLVDEVAAIKPAEDDKPVEKNPLKRDFSGGGDTAGDITNIINNGGGGKWALTVLHRGVSIFREKWQQALNFLNPQVFEHRQFLPVLFKLKTATIADSLKADPSHPATQVDIEGSVPDTTLLALDFFNGRKSIIRRNNEVTTNYPAILGLDSQPINTRYFELDGDETSPDPTYYYGTNETGEKGWHDLSAVVTDTIVGTPDTLAYYNSLGNIASNTITVNASGDIAGVNTLTVDGGTNTIDIGDGTAEGQLVVWSDNNKYLELQYRNNSSENLNLYIENDKAVLEDGDILIYNALNNTFKVDKLTNYANPLLTGTEDNTVRFNTLGELEETNLWRINAGAIDAFQQVFIHAGDRLGFYDTTDTYATYLRSHATPTATAEYYLPPADGTNNQVLTTNGLGQMSWETAEDILPTEITTYRRHFLLGGM